MILELLKQIVISLSLLVSLLQGEPMFGAVVKTDTDIVTEQKASEDEHFLINGKYQSIPETKDGIYTKSVDEFLNSKGEVGYRILLKKEDLKHYYQMSKGFGLNAVENTYDWKITGDVPPGIASTTTP